MYAKMRASIFTCRRFGYKYCYIFISCIPRSSRASSIIL